MIGALFPSFHSFLSPGRSLTERFCVEEITEAIKWANNCSWSFSTGILFQKEVWVKKEEDYLFSSLIRNSHPFKQESPSFLNGTAIEGSLLPRLKRRKESFFHSRFLLRLIFFLLYLYIERSHFLSSILWPLRSGFEPLTQGFSVLCSNQLSYLNHFPSVCFLHRIAPYLTTWRLREKCFTLFKKIYRAFFFACSSSFRAALSTAA